LKAEQDKAADLDKKLIDAQSVVAKCGLEYQDLKASLDRERAKSALLTERLDNSLKLAESRRLELKGVESFLKNADIAAVGDVRRAMNELNARIRHAAAVLMTMAFHNIPILQAPHADTRLEVHIGAQMARRGLKEHEQFILQDALQAVIIHFASRNISRWSYASERVNERLVYIYKSIRQAGGPGDSYYQGSLTIDTVVIARGPTCRRKMACSDSSAYA
jgi:hypothetical protein